MSYIDSNSLIVDPLTPTVFHEPWWLEIMTRGQCQVAEVSENGRVVGRLPYFTQKRLGMTKIVVPPLTHFLGPAIVDAEDKHDNRFLKRQAITNELIGKLPPASLIYIKCQCDITDVIAFQGKGFRSSVQFTHEIHPQAIEVIWGKMHSKRQGAITKAQKQLSCEEIADPSQFFRFNEQNLKAHGLTSSYSLDLFYKLVEKCLEKKQGRILAAKDDKGELATATFCVWDKRSYYFLMGTRKRDAYRGALSLLTWESIKDAMQKNLIFDLDGLSNDGSVAFYSGFGASISPRYIVTRETPIRAIVSAVRALGKKDNFYY